jgi:hypothetical protein
VPRHRALLAPGAESFTDIIGGRGRSVIRLIHWTIAVVRSGVFWRIIRSLMRLA